MNPINDDRATPRVSILARAVPALAFIIASLGAAASAYHVRYVLWAMRAAESAGVSAVAGGLREANLFALTGLYLAAVVGLVGILIYLIRILAGAKTVSPSSLFFIAVCLVGLPAPVFLWAAESTLIGALRQPSPAGIATAAFAINWLTILSMLAAPLAIFALLAVSVWPLATTSQRRWGPVIGMLAIAVLLVILAVAFQVRTSWLYHVKELEHWF